MSLKFELNLLVFNFSHSRSSHTCMTEVSGVYEMTVAMCDQLSIETLGKVKTTEVQASTPHSSFHH